MFLEELQPILKKFQENPMVFISGMIVGVFDLDVNSEPLKSWLKEQNKKYSSDQDKSSNRNKTQSNSMKNYYVERELTLEREKANLEWKLRNVPNQPRYFLRIDPFFYDDIMKQEKELKDKIERIEKELQQLREKKYKL